MKQVSTEGTGLVEFRQDVQALLRTRIREAIQMTLDEELTEALGCDRYERNGQRRGYRNGSQRRRVTTAQGLQELDIPRGRIVGQDGSTREFRSAILPRYARRARQVDEAILGAYLAGANTRRIRKALSPLLGKAHLTKSTISRVVGRLKAYFERWRQRDVSGERYWILYLDGFHLKVRLARRVVSAPVLAVLGVQPDGQKVLVALQLAVSEAAVHWQGLIESLVRRGLQAPEVLIADGHKGLAKAIEVWPDVSVQRCTQHKWSNLRDHCPVHARAEMKRVT